MPIPMAKTNASQRTNPPALPPDSGSSCQGPLRSLIRRFCPGTPARRNRACAPLLEAEGVTEADGKLRCLEFEIRARNDRGLTECDKQLAAGQEFPAIAR